MNQVELWYVWCLMIPVKGSGERLNVDSNEQSLVTRLFLDDSYLAKRNKLQEIEEVEQRIGIGRVASHRVSLDFEMQNCENEILEETQSHISKTDVGILRLKNTWIVKDFL